MSDEPKTETVVVHDANAAHALIGRTKDGNTILGVKDDGQTYSFTYANQYGVCRQWGESVEVNALPPATMWVHLDDLPGNKLPGETEAVFSFYREADGFYWSPDKPGTKPLPPIVDHKVEVLAPVPVVEVVDEVTVKLPRDVAEAIASSGVWDDNDGRTMLDALRAALAADRGEA